MTTGEQMKELESEFALSIKQRDIAKDELRRAQDKVNRLRFKLREAKEKARRTQGERLSRRQREKYERILLEQDISMNSEVFLKFFEACGAVALTENYLEEVRKSVNAGQNAVLVLRSNGYTYSEIGDILGVTEGYTRQMYNLGIRMLAHPPIKGRICAFDNNDKEANK